MKRSAVRCGQDTETTVFLSVRGLGIAAFSRRQLVMATPSTNTRCRMIRNPVIAIGDVAIEPNLCPSVDLIDRRSQSLSATLVDITFFLPGSRFHNSYGTSLFDPYGWPLRPPWSRGRKPVSGCGHEIDVGCVLLESAARLESALDQTRAESRTQFLDVMDSPRPCP
jgi:hypothetical protein